MAQPLVAIVVLTWDQKDLTLECLASLATMHYPLDRLQIIVADNGSSDGTVDAIKTAYPSVQVIENGANLGFAEGNNAGVRHALKGPADYIMLLNNDTAVDGHMLTYLVEAMEHDPAVGIVGPKMLYFDSPDVIWCAGSMVNWGTGESLRLQADVPDHQASELTRPVDFITACGILLRRQVIEQIGLLDPRFFIYYEETDWCARAVARGWKILYVPKARMWHRVSVSLGATSPATDYYMNRNVLLFLAKNRAGMGKLTSLVRAATRNLLTVAAYTAKPHGGRRLPNRNTRLLALRDAVLGRWGKMGRDVEVACRSNRS